MSLLGRFQRGERVVVEISETDLPDGDPVAAVMGSAGNSVGSYAMSYAPDLPGFRRTLRLGAEYAWDTYTVSVTYSVAGIARQAQATFGVVPGGDSGGPVISLYSYDRPEGRYILAQTGGGRLTQGRNPKLS